MKDEYTIEAEFSGRRIVLTGAHARAVFWCVIALIAGLFAGMLGLAFIGLQTIVAGGQ